MCEAKKAKDMLCKKEESCHGEKEASLQETNVSALIAKLVPNLKSVFGGRGVLPRPAMISRVALSTRDRLVPVTPLVDQINRRKRSPEWK